MFTTLMRKLMAVFIIAVFSVGLYGCGGSGGSHRSTPAEMTEMTDTPQVSDVVLPAEVAATVTTAGTHDIAAGSMMDVGDVTFTCPAG